MRQEWRLGQEHGGMRSRGEQLLIILAPHLSLEGFKLLYTPHLGDLSMLQVKGVG